MNAAAFILWEVRPEIWPDGPLPLRWYGLMFAAAFALGQFIIAHIFKRDGKPASDVDALNFYMILGTVLGARLGHCLFYQPDYYFSHPLEILKVWEGGLASHGATIGIILAMWLYTRKRKDQSWLWILDRIVIVVALGGSFIRMGNLMNSEIIGKPADLPWSLVFLQPFESALRESEAGRLENIRFSSPGGDTLLDGRQYKNLDLEISFRQGAVTKEEAATFTRLMLPGLVAASNGDEEQLRLRDDGNFQIETDEQGRSIVRISVWGLPRHPAMVYEAASNFLLFILLFMLWKNTPGMPEGRLFGSFVVILFSLRFFYEFLKENQVDFEDSLSLNMGQVLSIPMVMAGGWILFRSFRMMAEKK